MLKAAVMGYGTIGSGVVEVLDINRDLIVERAGQGIEIKYPRVFGHTYPGKSGT